LNRRTFQEALAYAIDQERDAAGQYDLFSHRATKPATRSMFAALAAEERTHQTRLEGITPAMLTTCAGKLIAEPSSTAPGVSFDPDMDFVAALRLAIQHEEEAIRLYDAMRSEAGDEKLCGLLTALVEQEQGHRAKLQEELDSVVLRDY
jgi:rubrerythrin